MKVLAWCGAGFAVSIIVLVALEIWTSRRNRDFYTNPPSWSHG